MNDSRTGIGSSLRRSRFSFGGRLACCAGAAALLLPPAATERWWATGRASISATAFPMPRRNRWMSACSTRATISRSRIWLEPKLIRRLRKSTAQGNPRTAAINYRTNRRDVSAAATRIAHLTPGNKPISTPTGHHSVHTSSLRTIGIPVGFNRPKHFAAELTFLLSISTTHVTS